MKTDVIIVGGGIVGLATAFLAQEKGLSVRVIDRSEKPVGSSIQNFGHACFTGQADDVQEMAMASREGWKRAARAAGLWAYESGTFIPAISDAEMQVLREFREKRGEDQVRLLDPEEVARGIGNPQLNSLGGAHLPLDMRVDPREAAPMLAAWLAANGVEFNWRHEVHAVADGQVTTNRGDFSARHVVVCPNCHLTQLYPELADKFDLRVCTLTMALIERPEGIPHDLAMLTGTSLARYDGFTDVAAAETLRADLRDREPELVDCIANLMVTGLDDYLLIGDSHEYAYSPEPFIEQQTADLLMEKATGYLGIENPRVVQRWQGRYADSRATNLIMDNPDARTTVAVVASGIGMTMSFGVANEILKQL